MSFYLLKSKYSGGTPDNVYLDLNEVDMVIGKKKILKDSITYSVEINLKSDNKCYSHYNDEETARKIMKDILQTDNVDDFEFSIDDQSDLDKKKELLRSFLSD